MADKTATAGRPVKTKAVRQTPRATLGIVSAPDLQVVRRTSALRQQVVEKLRDAIVQMKLLPGARLIERELCETTGTSRPLIREALRQLEAEGLVQNVPYRGLIVAVFGVEEAQGIYELRAALEALAGRSFTERATQLEITQLKAALREIRNAYAEGGSEKWLDAKTQFYDVLLAGARNDALRDAIQRLHAKISLLRTTSLSQRGRLTQSFAELRTIIKAIERRDAAAAAAACQLHVENAAAVAMQAFLKRDGAEAGTGSR